MLDINFIACIWVPIKNFMKVGIMFYNQELSNNLLIQWKKKESGQYIDYLLSTFCLTTREFSRDFVKKSQNSIMFTISRICSIEAQYWNCPICIVIINTGWVNAARAGFREYKYILINIRRERWPVVVEAKGSNLNTNGF